MSVRVGNWILSFGDRSTTISPDRNHVYSFDLEGRPLSWYSRDRVFKRSLASDIFGRERVAGRKLYWRVEDAEAVGHFADVLAWVERVPVERLHRDAVGRIEEILEWSPERLLAERRRFAEVYSPITILPPDQYLAVVLQATFGCSWNRCTFCGFYQDRPFRTRRVEEFDEHCRAVGRLLGRGADLRKRVFLADGNSLTLSNRRLRPLLDIACRHFPGRDLSGFIDVFGGENKEVEDWTELRALGLKRVYIGLETGDDTLLRWLNKPGTAAEAKQFIGLLERAGLHISVIFLVGVGGDRHAEAHVRHTLDLAARLPLDEQDVVYLSPFHCPDGSAYQRRASEAQVRPLSPAELDLQYGALRSGIRRALPQVRVTRYDLREFIY